MISWYEPPADPRLRSGDVHLWCATLDESATAVRLVDTLSADERVRAERFRFERDRRRFVAARGLLRAILGRYLDRAPAALRFCAGPYGKPALTQEDGNDDLRFNVSHAGDLALFAIARGREVGVDVERVRAEISLDSLIATCCSPQEIVALNACPPRERAAAFFACWTAKEAYLKGIGRGLSLPLDRLTVDPVVGDRPPRLTAGETPVDDWPLRSCDPGPGYVAVIAAEGRGWHVLGLRPPAAQWTRGAE